MVRQMNNFVQKPGFYFRAALCIIIPAVVARLIAILSLGMTVDSGASETVLFAARHGYLLFFFFSNAAALTLISVAIYTAGTKCAARIMGIFILCLGVDVTVKFFAEGYGSGVKISDYDAILSAVTYISDFLIAVAIAFGVWIVSSAFFRVYKSRDHSRKYSLKSAVNAAILMNFSVPFVKLMVKSVAGLFDANRQPTVTAIGDAVYEAVEILVFYAVIAFIGSRITLAICTKRDF